MRPKGVLSRPEAWDAISLALAGPHPQPPSRPGGALKPPPNGAGALPQCWERGAAWASARWLPSPEVGGGAGGGGRRWAASLLQGAFPSFSAFFTASAVIVYAYHTP